MTKPTVYIVTSDGLVQEVYVHALFGADANIVICNLDSTEPEELDEAQRIVKELPEFAHKVY